MKLREQLRQSVGVPVLLSTDVQRSLVLSWSWDQSRAKMLKHVTCLQWRMLSTQAMFRKLASGEERGFCNGRRNEF
jgi:hypothetical protein